MVVHSAFTGTVSRAAIAALIVTGATFTAPALSQVDSTTAAPTPSSADLTNPAVGDIVVTAQRRSERLEKVPVSVTAVDSQTISQLNLRNVAAVAAVTPGVVLDTAFSFPTFFIRGIGAQNRDGVGLETPVAIYIDGAYNPRNTGTPFDLYDAASVEVLKGPQGTLYGRNASGGAILIKTADPTFKFGASVAGESGNFDHQQVDVMVNMPANDTLSLRLAGRYRNDGGFITNVYDGQHVRGKESEDIRGKVLWAPSSSFKSVLTADYHHDVGVAQAVAREDSPVTGTSSLKFNQVDSDFIIHEPTNAYNINLNMRYNLGEISITNITDYRHAHAVLSDDNDHSPLPLVAINAAWGGNTFSDDLQLASSFGGIFDFLGGLLYAHDHGTSRLDLYGAAVGAPYVGSTIPANATPSRQIVNTETYGAFAEAYVRPLEHMTLTLGGRISHDARLLIASAPSVYRQRYHDTEFTPRAVVAYDLGQANIYASYTRGYLAGGFNIPTFGPQNVLNPERINGYEAGIKFVSPDRRTRVNVAAFYYQYKDILVTLCCVASVAVTQNAASATGKGLEFDFSQRAGRWLSFGAGGSYLDAKYKKFPGGAVFVPVYGNPADPTTPTSAVQGTADLSGTRLPRAPKWTGYANLTAEGPVFDGWNGRLSVVGRYSSKYLFSSDGGGPLLTDVQKAFGTLNVSAAIGPSDKKYEIGLYVDNVSSTKYYSNRAIGAFGLDSRIAMPRSYGISVKASY